MKKLFTALFLAFALMGFTFAGDNFNILTLFSTKPTSQNYLWVGTFQLVFNDMKENIIKRNVEFVGEKETKELKDLNKAEFNKDMLNPESYYTSYGKTNPKAKEKIKRALKAKFNESSDILDSFDWTEGIGKYYAYAMLKKEFEFLQEFEKLGKMPFNSKGEFEFFGLNSESSSALRKNVEVISYKNENNFAVKLLTKNNDIVYLYRTDLPYSFKNLYSKMLKDGDRYKGDRNLSEGETLKVPNLKLKSQKKYPELCNRIIKGTANLYFSDAIETIDLELDNKGGKVKSEAMLMTRMMSLAPVAVQNPRHFDFDKTFVLFLVDAGKKDPYLALRVKNLEGLQ